MTAADYPVTFGYDSIAVKNPLTIDGDVTTIHCTRGDILIDTEDIGLIMDRYWNIATRGYAESTSRSDKNSVKMHRLLMEYPDKEVDHINGNPLDNRKSNLRICEHHENGRNLKLKVNNTSGVAGVSWDKARNKWRARIKLNYTEVHIGRFDDIQKAIDARKKAEVIYFGEFARV